ncbi:chromosome segregation protein SMC [Puniceicoccaceae bacterium K14]|nr:chromosome segregation protein SMC [Puniceicoccaceae bacterium K14]
MYLSSLKVNGFKSFADSTHLRFEPGVTAVVGPNGCGKSNIADSIRWVLGEQSAKALRGGKMQDVIFEGTDKRKPLNLCEVSITLTDCEKELGADFNEVEITRRVQRDGGSNYFINGKGCRLKDIQRLFMDTGIGRTSYSIMAQGQIDQILSSKPEERRAVFEEAAGISKYKAQRKETLNKLALVETNLNRVTDVVAEIGRQIGSLKRQATKAIRFKKLSHKLRHLDVGYSAYQYGNLSSSLQFIDKSAGSLESEVEKFRTELEQKETHLVINKEERQSLTQRVQDAQQSVFDLRSMKEQIANQADMARIKISSLEERVQASTEEIESFESQVGEIAAKLDEDSQDKQMHMDVLGNSDEIFHERNRELAEIEERLQETERVIQQCKVQAMEAERNSSRAREQRSAFEVEARTNDSRLMRLEEELAEQSEGHGEAEEALSSFRSRLEESQQAQTDLQGALEASRESVSQEREAFKAAQNRIQELDRVVTQKNARVKLLQQLQEKLEGYGEGAKALLRGKMQGDLANKKFSPIATNLSVKKGYNAAVEALLGSAVEAVTVSDAQTVEEIFQQLEERKIGRVCLRFETAPSAPDAAVAMPEWLKPALDFIDENPNDSNPLKAVLAACYVVEDMGAFLRWWETQPDFRFLQVASKTGETVDRRGVVTGGYKKAKNSSILQRETELKQTVEDLKNDEKALGDAKTEADVINKRVDDAEEAVEGNRHQLAECNREISTLTAEVRNAERAVQDQRMKAERLENEKEILMDLRAQSDEKLRSAEARMKEEEESLNSIREKLAEAEQGTDDIRNVRDEKREALTQAKYDLQDKKQKLDIINQGLVEMEQRRNELTRLVESKSRDIESWTQESDELRDGIDGVDGRVEEVEVELEEAKALVDRCRQTLVTVEEKIGILEQEQTSIREKLDGLKNNLSGQQVEIAEKRSRLEFIQEEITREYSIDLRNVDWKFELWTAAQPVKDLPQLDADPEDEIQEDAEGEGEAVVPVDTEEEVEAKAEEVSSEETEEAESEETAVNAEPTGPTEEELSELDDTNWSKVKADIQKIRKRVQGMGAVNTEAIAEYGELRERHGFLKEQYDDLTSSKEKLVFAIDEINTKSREQFTATFSQIRDNFKQTFNTLFNGGKADLQLIETDDVLESGIEIVAQPPGTRLKGVGLLSGGQKTMTAVGLLFAIYMVKPSPFCLLDELDAPLDESNIGRFTTLLKQFTKQSQFIIITHNKRTLAAAQAIYGVTMQEKGVSKVVSMRFNSEHDDEDIVTLKMVGS